MVFLVCTALCLLLALPTLTDAAGSKLCTDGGVPTPEGSCHPGDRAAYAERKRAVDCMEWCLKWKHNEGNMVGTGPFCEASCSSSCASAARCTAWPSDCVTGHRVCCCTD